MPYQRYRRGLVLRVERRLQVAQRRRDKAKHTSLFEPSNSYVHASSPRNGSWMIALRPSETMR
eukprot:2470864-Pyramimonas_sp.AAC.1